MARVWGYEAALDTGTVTVHVRRLREKIEDDPSSPAPADRLGRRLPVRAVIGTALLIAALDARRRARRGAGAAALPTVRLQLAGLASSRSLLPLAAVLCPAG